MNFLHDPDRELLIRQILTARTLQQIGVARTALRRWRERYPDDWSILDAGEQMSHTEEALLEGDSLDGKPLSWTEWQWLEYQVMGARALPEIQEARSALRQWAEQHPGETKPDLLEALFFLLDVVEDEQSGKSGSSVQTERELAGQAV